MLSKLQDLYYAVYRGCRNVWNFVRYDFHQGVGNLVRWFPIIWQDRDWDHAYLLQMMEKKMGRMAELHENHGHCVGSPRIARQLRVAARICKRLREDEYYELAEKRYPRPKDWKMWTEPVENSDIYKVKITPDPMVRFRIELATTVQKQDKEMLGRLIGKYIDHWWD